MLATASGKRVRLWGADGTPRLETESHASTITGLAWSSDGKQLATCCYGGVQLWNVAAGAQGRHLPWKGSLISLAWSPDDRVIACASQDCSVHFWRLDSAKDSEMTGYPFKPRAIAWDARGSMLATSGDATITCWDFSGKGPEGTSPLQLVGHKTLVTCLAFSPRRAVLASGAQDSSVLLWEPRRGQPKRDLGPVGYAFLEDEISGMAWDREHRSLVAVDAAGHVACWQAPA
jgi:WD40 repeat protein